ncbi:DUF6527 family protein [Mesorhizobium sp. GbtcB19]|uniref:DUF6527 family protein n=1 Tax=Mesorhizobium sp. GbtcB19 TaxID=2824764 RepID=UPI0034D58342
MSADVPEKTRPRTVYLIGDDGPPWAAAFICPCGCGELVRLSLVRRDSPSWVASVGKGGRADLHPSVRRIRGCRSHYFIRDGRIVWARDERRVST